MVLGHPADIELRQPASETGLKVLVVEDESVKFRQHWRRRCLRDMDCTVLEAADGRLAFCIPGQPE